MFISKERPETHIEAALERAISELANHAVESAEYGQIMNQIEKLHAMKESEKPSRVSKDTWAMIGANLTGILLIIHHERADIITSKALSFAQKIR